MHTNEVKKTLANIAYRNERAITFEKFVATLQKAIDDLEMYGHGIHNGDIFDLLWTKIGNPDLAPYVVSMKVHYQVVRRGYKEIEKFVATFQKAIEDLEMYGRGMYNGDIVDLLWTKMGNPELAPYVVSMKVH